MTVGSIKWYKNLVKHLYKKSGLKFFFNFSVSLCKYMSKVILNFQILIQIIKTYIRNKLFKQNEVFSKF